MCMNFLNINRESLVYDFVTLTQQERSEKKENYAKFEAEKAAQKAAPKVEEKAE